MPLTLKSLYPHLNDEDIKNIQTFNDNYNIDDTITESDELLLKNLNDEAAVLKISPGGHFCRYFPKRYRYYSIQRVFGGILSPFKSI